MPLYTVRINVTGVAALDGVTPLDLAASTVTNLPTGDRVVDVTTPGPFGIFDPGSIQDLQGDIFQVMSLDVISDVVASYSAGSEVRVQSPATIPGNVTREVQIQDLQGTPGLFPALSKIFPVGHNLVFDTTPEGGASGPYMVQIGLCSIGPEDCALVLAQQACCDTPDVCCAPQVVVGGFPAGSGVQGFPIILSPPVASITVTLPGCNLDNVQSVDIKRNPLGPSTAPIPTLNGVSVLAATATLPEQIAIDLDTSASGSAAPGEEFVLVLQNTCGCCTMVPINVTT